MKFFLEKIKGKMNFNKSVINKNKTDNFYFKYNPLISILIPTYMTNTRHLTETIESVISQTYQNWEICIADGNSDVNVTEVLRNYEKEYKNIKIKYLDANKGISQNSNEALVLCSGEYISLLDHDDILDPNALYEIVKCINENSDRDVIYTDEDKLDLDGKRKYPVYKPDWSPDLLNNNMYIGHLLTFKKVLIDKIGGFRSQYDGSQDYDLMLRLSRVANTIYHIPKALYSWRISPSSTTMNIDSKPYAQKAGLESLNEYLKIKYGKDSYAKETEFLYVYDPRYNLSSNNKVSIIIAVKSDYSLNILENSIDSIVNITNFNNYEIIIVINNLIDVDFNKYLSNLVNKNISIKVINKNYEYNWARLNNEAIDNANGDILVFLSYDIIVEDGDWLERLCENAMRDEIGVVGPLTVSADNIIQSCGIVIGLNGYIDSAYNGQYMPPGPCPYQSPVLSRNVSALSGSCLVVSRKIIDKIGSFNENFRDYASVIEMCLRIRRYGFYNLYNARVKIVKQDLNNMYNSIYEEDLQRLANENKDYFANNDPYYNINLDYSCVFPKSKIDG